MFKKRIATCLALVIIAGILSFQVGAIEITSNNVTIEQGGLTAEEKNMTKDDILKEALSRPGITKQEKKQIIDKDAQMQKILKDKQEQVVSATSGSSGILPMTSTATYALLVTPVKQETSTWCSAATIKQTLIYINGSCTTSQQTIMNSVGAAPGLQKVLDYLNARISLTDYIREPVANRTEFDSCLDYDVYNYQPMVFTLKNTQGLSAWPYNTGGHFTNNDGYLNSAYLISDPYYFLKYVASASDDNGYHYESWTKVWNVNTQLFGAGENHVGY